MENNGDSCYLHCEDRTQECTQLLKLAANIFNNFQEAAWKANFADDSSAH